MGEEELKGMGPSRRDFLKGITAGVIGGGAMISGVFVGSAGGIVSEVGVGGKQQAPFPAAVGYTASFKSKAPPRSQGYLLVDTKKCSSCQSCMVACSLTHTGKENVSLSRIQIIFDSWGKYPDDAAQMQCRQCIYPMCLAACPTGALHADEKFGNVRTVDKDLCIGCQRCIEACPFAPNRTIWYSQASYSQKCDLCADTPYWSEKGGPGGKQACVEVCPLKAISFTAEVPTQAGYAGYNVNLRTINAGRLGLERT